MGKNSVIRTLGKRIGNVVLHKLLAKYTNKPESINHLQKEEAEYRAAAIRDAKRYYWNEEDRHSMKKEAIEFLKIQKERKYPDIIIPLSTQDIEKMIDEEITNIKV